MRKCRSAAFLLLALAGPLSAETVPADCALLTGALRTVQGYELTVPPAGDEGGWCVLDGAALKSAEPGRPDLTADRLRLRGMVADGVPVTLEVDLTGLRVRPKAGDRDMDDRLRSLVRLQTADLRLSVQAEPESGILRVDTLTLRLSGGTEILLSAEVAGAGLTAGSLPGGRLVAFDLAYRNDGQLLRPLMAQAGERLAPGLTDTQAVDAARGALREILAALPEAMFEDESRDALERMVTAVPRGRGLLELSFRMPEGMGAARVLRAGLAADPLGPDALQRLLQGARLTAVWTPGLAP